MANDCGKTDSDGNIRRDVAELLDEFDDSLCDVLWFAAVGSRELDSFADELTGVQVDQGPLDSGSADVDS